MSFLFGVLSSIAATILIALSVRLPLIRPRISFRVVMKDVRHLAELVNADSSCRPEVIVGINRSGAIVSGILCGLIRNSTISAPCILGLELERRDGKRYTGIGPHAPDLSGVSNLLLVAFANDTGSTIEAALHWLRSQSPNFKVHTAALYSNPKSVVTPHFIGKEIVDGPFTHMNKYLVRMPWMTRGWRHDLASERLKSR